MKAKADIHGSNPDRPVIGAWLILNTKSDPVLVHERNPYYWKVDTEGNQLPYIDRVGDTLYTDA